MTVAWFWTKVLFGYVIVAFLIAVALGKLLDDGSEDEW